MSELAGAAAREALPRATARQLAGRSLGLVGTFGVLGLVALLSIRLGSSSLGFADIVDSVFAFDPASDEQVIVRDLRLPRTVVGLVVGASLGLVGAIMQAALRNGLADPGILGVNVGAAMAAAFGVYFLGFTSSGQYVWLAFAGGALAAVLVYVLGSVGRGGQTPVKLTLAGVVVGALLTSWMSALLITDDRTLEQIRFWLVGSLQSADFALLAPVLPFFAVGIAAALLLGAQLNLLGLGDDLAASLGQRTGLIRAACGLVSVVLAGAAVAVAGPIGFVGLAVPHAVRALVGPDYRWILPYSMLGGAILLLSADIVGRLVVRPSEIQVGIVTALVGGPVLILLTRRARLART